MRKTTALLTTAALTLGVSSVSTADHHSKTIETRWADVKVETVAEGLVRPWGLAFLPDGRYLVTELPGRMRVIAEDGSLGDPLNGVPEVAVRNQGGLLDVILSPDFESDNTIYYSFSEPESPGSEITSTAVAKATLGDDAIMDSEVIFSQYPKVDGGRHYGGRMVFTHDGDYLYVGLGDRGHQMMESQDLDSHTGTIVRLYPDGSAPDTNPYAAHDGALDEIWSYGHRNVQGIDIQPGTGLMWAVEHGPQGGDEINLPEAGKNYGWPVITHGEQYGGGEMDVSEGFKKEGMELPVWHWTPSIAVSGMTFYDGDKFPEWKGNILAGGLRGQLIARMEVDYNRVIHEEIMDMDYRIRTVKQGPDGYIYVLTDERDNAKLLRLRPAE